MTTDELKTIKAGDQVMLYQHGLALRFTVVETGELMPRGSDTPSILSCTLMGGNAQTDRYMIRVDDAYHPGFFPGRILSTPPDEVMNDGRRVKGWTLLGIAYMVVEGQVVDSAVIDDEHLNDANTALAQYDHDIHWTRELPPQPTTLSTAKEGGHSDND